jgi:hypothetical protein
MESSHDLQYDDSADPQRSTTSTSSTPIPVPVPAHQTNNRPPSKLSNFFQAGRKRASTWSSTLSSSYQQQQSSSAKQTHHHNQHQHQQQQPWFSRQTSSVSSHSKESNAGAGVTVVGGKIGRPAGIGGHVRSVSGGTSSSVPLSTRSLGSQTSNHRNQKWNKKQNLVDLIVPPPTRTRTTTSSVASGSVIGTGTGTGTGIGTHPYPFGPLSISSQDGGGSCSTLQEISKLEDILLMGTTEQQQHQQQQQTNNNNYGEGEEETVLRVLDLHEPWLEYPQPVNVNININTTTTTTTTTTTNGNTSNALRLEEEERKAIFQLPYQPSTTLLDREYENDSSSRGVGGTRTSSTSQNYLPLHSGLPIEGCNGGGSDSGFGDSVLDMEVNSSMISPEFRSMVRTNSTNTNTTSAHVSFLSPLENEEGSPLHPSSSSSQQQQQQQQQQPPPPSTPDNSLQRKASSESSLQNAFDDCSKYCFCLPHVQKPVMFRCASAIVRYAPCFWCCGALELSATDRKILTRLNTLLATFALTQVGVGVFLLIVFLSDENPEGNVSRAGYYREALSPNLWMPLGNLILLAVVGFGIFITMAISVRGIRDMAYPVLIRTMWVIYWFLPLELIFVLALFDYYRVMSVWIKHWWSAKSMAWFRRVFCQLGTADTTCAIPYRYQENNTLANDWCIEQYNSTECQALRMDATGKMATMSYTFIYINLAVGCVLIVLLLFSLGLLESIISGPIVRESKESRIHFWLTLPGLGCLAAGFVLHYSPQAVLSWESGVSIKWISVSYITSGVLFLASALLGWYISVKEVLMDRNKTQKQFAIVGFMGMLVLTFLFVVGIIVLSVILNVDLGATELHDEQRGTIACFLDAASSCSNCNYTEDNVAFVAFNQNESQCPEWTGSDVSTIVQTQLKQSAILASIFAFYAITALNFGNTLRKKLLQYEIFYL